MTSNDLFIPRSFSPVGDESLDKAALTKSSSLALFYYLSVGDKNRASALAYMMRQHLQAGKKYPDYIDHQLLSEGSAAAVGDSVLADLWGHYSLLAFMVSLGPDDVETKRYFWDVERSVNAYVNQLSSGPLAESSGLVYLEAQVVAYFYMLLADTFYATDYSASVAQAYQHVLPFIDNSGKVNSVRNTDGRYNLYPSNSEAQLLACFVLNQEKDVLLTDALSYFLGNYYRPHEEAVSFLFDHYNRVSYTQTALYAYLAKLMGRTPQAESLVVRLSDLHKKTTGMVDANFDVDNLFVYSSEWPYRISTVSSVAATALFRLAREENTPLFSANVVSIYSFAIFDEGADGASSPSVLLSGSVDSASTTNQTVIQNV